MSQRSHGARLDTPATSGRATRSSVRAGSRRRVVAVCLMRKRRPGSSGVLLALASLERIFPACFFFGYGVRELCVWIRERKATPGFWRFVVGAGVASIAIAGAGTAVAGRGLPVWLDFAENTRGMVSFTPKNGLGFEYALRFTMSQPPDWDEKSGSESEIEATIQAPQAAHARVAPRSPGGRLRGLRVALRRAPVGAAQRASRTARSDSRIGKRSRWEPPRSRS